MVDASFKNFEYFDPTSLQDALKILNRLGGRGKVFAGGTDLLNLMKEGVLQPEAVVNIKRIKDLYYIRSESDGLRIGTLTKVADVAESQTIRAQYEVLAQAAERVASPNIRNMATVGGDVLQEVWCWYVRYNYDCWRNRTAPGHVCYGAIGDNRYYHSIFGGRLCYAVHPSDVAPALIALDARATIAGPSGTRSVTVEELIPGNILVNGRLQSHIVADNEIVTEFHIPPRAPGSKGVFKKVALREAIDFALAAVAINATFDGATVRNARIVLGGVATKPLRVPHAEAVLAGKRITADVALQVAEAALSGARPITFGTGNEYRVDMAKGVVKQAVLALA